MIIDVSGENIARDMCERNTQPSNLELRIRKETLELSEWLLDDLTHPDKFILEHSVNRAQRLKERLNLLWGE